MSFINGDGLRDVVITGEFVPSYIYIYIYIYNTHLSSVTLFDITLQNSIYPQEKTGQQTVKVKCGGTCGAVEP